jgi:adenosine deaminase
MIDPRLPFIDLHRHLDGNIRLETILDLGEIHGIPLPANDTAGLSDFVQIKEPSPGIMPFIEKMVFTVGFLADPEACKRIAYENVEDAYNEGIDYIELRFSPMFMAEAHQLDLHGVVEAVLEGIDQGRQSYDISVNLIGIISRTYGPDQCWKELEALLQYKDQIRALDLAGDEVKFPGDLFVDHIAEGRSAGWNITIHAGEEAGPDSVWQALEELKAERIGHGVSAVKDPVLMKYLADKRIGLESNLTSNFQTRVVASLEEHPLRIFLENGILATINSDDPGISAIDLKHEYEIAAPEAGLSPNQIQQAQKNALEVAFLDDTEKETIKMKTSDRGMDRNE